MYSKYFSNYLNNENMMTQQMENLRKQIKLKKTL